MPPQAEDKRQAAREVIDILHEISILLVCAFTSPFSVMALRYVDFSRQRCLAAVWDVN
jgi:hypothetical protein